jgi:hypothetical protein
LIVLNASLKHYLHADTYTEDWPVCNEPCVHQRRTVNGFDSGHTCRECSDPGDNKAICLGRSAKVIRQRDLGADMLERPNRRTNISESVIENNN